MVNGALMQLVAYGAQDLMLTGNPEISFFKAVYRQHTIFSIENIKQSFNDPASLGKKITCNIDRRGDLLGSTTLVMDVNPGGYDYFPAEQLVKKVDWLIDEKVIDSHDTYWFRVFNEMIRRDKKNEYMKLTNFTNYPFTFTTIPSGNQKLYLPLLFSFCRKSGLYLPLVSLPGSEVKIDVTFQKSSSSNSTLSDVYLYCDYIFLGPEERRFFTNSSHDYLIEQVQIQNEVVSTSEPNDIRLKFQHPVKSLFWIFNSDNTGSSNYGLISARISDNSYTAQTPQLQQYAEGSVTYSTQLSNEGSGSYVYISFKAAPWTGWDKNSPLSESKLVIDNNVIFDQDGQYFQTIQPFYYSDALSLPNIYSYSFALKWNEIEPNGTFNFSKAKNKILTIITDDNLTTTTESVTINNLKIYAVNYNILHIESGMGDIIFAN